MHTLAEITAAPSVATWLFLALALALALSFEFVNGFHDTANAVATVIYTHTLKPTVAVVWSGIWNLIGVLLSQGGVAFSIVALLPVDLVLNVGSASGFAMVFALLISAIVWNLGTWYLGLPASSSHTLVGSILGVGLANSMMHGRPLAEGVNWAEAEKVGMALLVSPAVGFVFSALMLVVLKVLVRKPELFTEPPKDKTPPPWIRALLVLTCTGVSYAHGRNDGQKGMGLLVLILVGILPGMYALNMGVTAEDIQKMQVRAGTVAAQFEGRDGAALDKSASEKELTSFLKSDGILSDKTYSAVAVVCHAIGGELTGVKTFGDVQEADRRTLRSDIYLAGAALGKLGKASKFPEGTDKVTIVAFQQELESVTKYIPAWVKIAVACALGFGTMVGWKRIVVTVGEKIGKSHLTYAQGASAELIAGITILLADYKHLPVSTTHVLSSGVAGTMAANGSGLQAQTLRNILLAWVLTLPVCIFLGSVLFAFANYFVFHIIGLH